MTAPRGVPYIATRAEAQIGGAVALEMLPETHDEVDAAIMAACRGSRAVRRSGGFFDVAVVGMAEAAMLTSCMLGRRFAIVAFARALGPWYRECIEMHGLVALRQHSHAQRGIWGYRARARGEGRASCVAQRNARSARTRQMLSILAGAPLAGLARKVEGAAFRCLWWIRSPHPCARLRRWSLSDCGRPLQVRPRARMRRRRRGWQKPLASRIEHRDESTGSSRLGSPQ